MEAAVEIFVLTRGFPAVERYSMQERFLELDMQYDAILGQIITMLSKPGDWTVG